jgi:hypothetical protein
LSSSIMSPWWLKCEVALPGTIRLRFALVNATTPDAAVNTVATYAPYVSTAHSLASLAFNKGVSFFAGTATAEALQPMLRTGGCCGRPWTSEAVLLL